MATEVYCIMYSTATHHDFASMFFNSKLERIETLSMNACNESAMPRPDQQLHAYDKPGALLGAGSADWVWQCAISCCTWQSLSVTSLSGSPKLHTLNMTCLPLYVTSCAGVLEWRRSIHLVFSTPVTCRIELQHRVAAVHVLTLWVRQTQS